MVLTRRYTAVPAVQGIGFAIPASLAANVMEQIIEQGHVQRGWLGIEAQDLTPQLAESFQLSDTHGMLIAGVLRGGPADTAGIEPGDVIETINGDEIDNARSAMSQIAQSGPGARLKIRGIRAGQRFETTVITGRRPESQQSN